METDPYRPPESELRQENGPPIANPHVLWRQVTGLVFWVGLLSFAGGGLVGAAKGLALGGVTFADAWSSGIYKNPEKRSFLNISPMAWGIVMSLLFIVTYPVYLLNRNKLRTRQAGNGFFIATIAFGAVVIILAVINIRLFINLCGELWAPAPLAPS